MRSVRLRRVALLPVGESQVTADRPARTPCRNSRWCGAASASVTAARPCSRARFAVWIRARRVSNAGELAVVLVPVVDHDAGQVGEHECLEGGQGPVAQEVIGEQVRAGDQQVALAGLRSGTDPDRGLIGADHRRSSRPCRSRWSSAWTADDVSGLRTPGRIQPQPAVSLRQMGDVFDTAVDRTPSRLDVPQVTTLFAAKTRPPTPGATCRPGWRSRSRHLRMT